MQEPYLKASVNFKISQVAKRHHDLNRRLTLSIVGIVHIKISNDKLINLGIATIETMQ